MRYIWESFLDGTYDKMYCQVKEVSPYWECMPLAEQNDRIELNVWHRFYDIFGELLSDDTEGLQPLKERLLDAVVHILNEVDIKQGVDKTDLWIRILKRKMLNGEYGKRVAGIYEKMEVKRQYQVGYYLMKQQQAGASLKFYGVMIASIFKEAVLYLNKRNKAELMLVMGMRKRKQTEDELFLLEELFLPLGFTVRTFWETQFGVIDVKETMRIGEIELF